MAAELRTDAFLSSENSDSRKRPLDDYDDNGVSKKSHFSGDVATNLKMLVPSVAVGGIIGKGGETLAQLQKSSGVRIKMSKANDFYPGTSDRVCLITGAAESVKEAFAFILRKIVEKTDATSNKSVDVSTLEEEKHCNIQVKLLVPNSTAGMIIGKAGSYIKKIKEDSGAIVQISQKAKDRSLQERCVTVSGDTHNIIDASDMILSKIVEDPLSGSCLNISYADISGPVANNNPSGSPYAVPRRQQNSLLPIFNSVCDVNTSASPLSSVLSNDGTINLSLNLCAPCRGTSITSQLLEHIKYTLHGSGYNDQATNEITTAVVTLAKYGILGMGLGMTRNADNASVNNSTLLSSRNYVETAPMDSSHYSKPINNVQYSNSDMYGVIGGNIPNLSPNPGSRMLDAYEGTRQQPSTVSTVSNNEALEEPKKIELEIPENIVGAILGLGGRSLIEIQLRSGANIQISKKGSFAPGTRNRLVSITGSQNAINMAKYYVEKRIEEEEKKRARSQTNVQ